jgi:3-dehydroquinate dehydratase-1
LPDLKQKLSFQRFHNSPASKMCISVYGRSISDLNAKISEARRYNSAFIELRLDYLGDPSQIVKISKRFLGNEIFTFRSRAEGGVAKVSERERIEILRKILSLSRPPYVDIEISTLEAEPDLAKESKLAGSKLICSSHDFPPIESLNKLRSLVWRAHKRNDSYAIKVVRKARAFSDNRHILSLYSISEDISPSQLIAFCAGPFGILSRISCVQLGSPFTYVSLPDEKTAPGQLEVSKMQSLLSKW